MTKKVNMDKRQFKDKVLKMAKEMRVSVSQIQIRKMKNKIASCSSKGRLTFDETVLFEIPQRQIEIIIHELLHLRYHNHSRLFKAVYKAYIEKFTNVEI